MFASEIQRKYGKCPKAAAKFVSLTDLVTKQKKSHNSSDNQRLVGDFRSLIFLRPCIDLIRCRLMLSCFKTAMFGILM